MDVGCGAVVLGDVHVGDDSVIGANAVVIRDVPPRSVAAGVPARIVKTLGPYSLALSYDPAPRRIVGTRVALDASGARRSARSARLALDPTEVPP